MIFYQNNKVSRGICNFKKFRGAKLNCIPGIYYRDCDGRQKFYFSAFGSPAMSTAPG